jgi:putative hydrolase of the HAD superfamily
MLKNKKLFILDLDDTLIDTSDIYYVARESFIELFTGKYLTNSIIDTFEKIDTENFNKYGYDPHRYFISMVDTYKTLENLNDLQDIIPEIKKCYNLLFSKPKLISGAIELLEFLRKSHKKLCLFTRGKKEFQNYKIDSVGIRHYFDFIKVADNKDAKLFKEIIDRLGYSIDETVIIGDSIKSDIIPCMELKIDCIKYNYSHNNYEWLQDKVEIDSDCYLEVNNLWEVIAILN